MLYSKITEDMESKVLYNEDFSKKKGRKKEDASTYRCLHYNIFELLFRRGKRRRRHQWRGRIFANFAAKVSKRKSDKRAADIDSGDQQLLHISQNLIILLSLIYLGSKVKE